MSIKRTPSQMREDAVMWQRAGIPAMAVGRYMDAADHIQLLERLLRELIDIEGPQPGHVTWYRKVLAALIYAPIKGAE